MENTLSQPKELTEILNRFDYAAFTEFMKVNDYKWVCNEELRVPNVEEVRSLIVYLYYTLAHNPNLTITSCGRLVMVRYQDNIAVFVSATNRVDVKV